MGTNACKEEYDSEFKIVCKKLSELAESKGSYC